MHTDVWKLTAEPDDEAAALYAEELAAAGVAAAASGSKSTHFFGMGMRWEWKRVRTSGVAPSLRSGAAGVLKSNAQFLTFGGVCDEETEDALKGQFFNDLRMLNLSKGTWQEVVLKAPVAAKSAVKPPSKAGKPKKKHGGKGKGKAAAEGGDGGGGRRRRRGQDSAADIAAAVAEAGGAAAEAAAEAVAAQGGGDDDDRDTTSGSDSDAEDDDTGGGDDGAAEPSERMSAHICCRGHTLYLYGGICEVGDRQVRTGVECGGYAGMQQMLWERDRRESALIMNVSCLRFTRSPLAICTHWI
jgi:hypothetical protein